MTAFDAAFSIGESPGLLAGGTYRVEAALDGETLSTTFEVEGPEPAGEDGGLALGMGATARRLGQTPTTGPPTSGGSGAVGPPVDPTQSPSVTLVHTLIHHAPVDADAGTINVTVFGGVTGGGGRVQVKATMGGGSRTDSFPTDASGLVTRSIDFDPCLLPGGSDLPGTRATFDTTVFEGNAEVASVVDLTRLGEDTARPAVTLNANPLDRVTRGHRRVDHLRRHRPGGPPRVVLAEGRARASGAKGSGRGPGPTGPGRRVEPPALRPEAVEPGHPGVLHGPGGRARDLQDLPGRHRLRRQQERRHLRHLLHGRGLEGPGHGPHEPAALLPDANPGHGRDEAVVGGEGTVSGTVLERRGGFSCGGQATPIFERTYDVTGRRTATAFEVLCRALP